MSKAVYVYQGVKGLPAISKHTGIHISTLRNRVNRENLTINQAVELGCPKYGVRTKHEYHGICGLKNIAVAHQFPYGTLMTRVIQMGMPIKEALEKPIRQQRSSKNMPVLKIDPLWALALGIGGSHA
ncbi:TPA: hypothetical protein ACX3GV_000090 [Vibrio parahaemolyticus]